MRKKKILLCNESSMLSTGYSTYGYEVLTRLFNTGKYELAELAAYGSAEDLNSTNIPWKYFPVLPPKNNPELRARYESKATNKFGEFIFDEVCATFKPDIVWDIRDWWMALANPNDIIFTNKGIKNVSEISLGDSVLTDKGRYRKVTHIFNKLYSGKVLKFKVSNFGISLDLTIQHPVLAIVRNSAALPNFSKEKPQWVNSENLKIGDIVCLPITNGTNTGISNDEARLLGYYASEGCLMYEGKKELNIIKGIQLTFCVDEMEYVEEVKRIIKDVFNKDITYKIVNNTIIVRAFSKTIGEFCKFHCGELSGKKELCPELFFATNNIIKSFLCSLFRGDGCYNESNNRASYCTKSKKLAIQVFYLCNRLGIVPSFSFNKNKIKDREYHRYIFGFDDEASYAYKAIITNKNINNFSKRIHNNKVLLTITEITEEEVVDAPVFNFEVEEDNTYVSSFILHNCEFEERSPARPYYHWVIMPTVDSAPQHDDWISTFMNADGVFAYSDWGLEEIKKQSNNKIKTQCSAPPGANLRDFKCLNKTDVRKKIGIPDDSIVIGTVMRNQLRKLYPDLMESFAKFLQEAPPEIASKAYLYIHCCYPDVGWDIPKLLKEHGIGSRTYFTYQCTKCKDIYPSRFQDGRAPCRFCGQHSAFLPDIKTGVPSTILNEIMAMFDVYVQYAVCEGFGMPQVEAAASGTPVMAVDYSAMSDVVRKLKGTPLKVQRLFRDIHTESYRALPDNDFLVKSLIDFFKQPKEVRLQQGVVAANEVSKHYTWERTTKIWEDYFDSVIPLDRWKEPARISEPDLNVPSNLSDTEFVNWAFNKIGNRPDLINSYLANKVTRDLGLGVCINGLPNILVDPEYSNESFGTYGSFTREHLASRLVNLCQMKNIFEKRRTL